MVRGRGILRDLCDGFHTLARDVVVIVAVQLTALGYGRGTPSSGTPIALSTGQANRHFCGIVTSMDLLLILIVLLLLFGGGGGLYWGF
ncbi:MAG: hypothetical protein ACREU6_17485, partial [Steroidobacteraceae bacterium]